MAISLPANFVRDIEGRDTVLVPVVQFKKNYTRITISTNDFTEAGGNHWLPLLLNVPSLKESIDIEKRNYKISSVTLDISNYEYNGKRFSDLFAETYGSAINVECRIFWKSPSTVWLLEEGSSGWLLDEEGSPASPDMAMLIYNGTIRRYNHDDEKVKLVVEDRSQATLHKDLPDNTIHDGGTIKHLPIVYGQVDNSPLILDKINRQLWIDSADRVYLAQPSATYFDDLTLSSVKIYDNDNYYSLSENLAIVHGYYEDLETGDVEIPSGFFSEETLQYTIDGNIITLNNNVLFQSGAIQCTTLVTPRLSMINKIATGPSQELFNYHTIGYAQATVEGDYVDITSQGDDDSSQIGKLTDLLVSPYSGVSVLRDYTGSYQPETDLAAGLEWTTGYAPFYELLIDCKVPGSRFTNVIRFEINDKNMPLKIDGSQKWHTRISPFSDLYTWNSGAIHINVQNTWDDEWSSKGFTDIGHSMTEFISLREEGGNPYILFDTGGDSSIFTVEVNYYSGNIGYNTPVLHYGLGMAGEAIINISSENWVDYNWTGRTRFRMRMGNITTAVSMDIENPLNKDFYADINGRLRFDTGQGLVFMPNAAEVIEDILVEEVKYAGTIDLDRSSYGQMAAWDWQSSFTLNKKINSKQLIEQIASTSPYIPRFDNIGNFKFDVIKTIYDNGDLAVAGGNETIKESDVIDFSFSRTKIEDVKTSIQFKYHYDYARDEFAKDLSHTDYESEEIKADELIDGYDPEYYGLQDFDSAPLIIDDDRGKYIRHDDTALAYAKWMLLWHCNQHLKIKVKLPLKYMNLEIGDTVEYDAILGGVKPYGIDYKKGSHHWDRIINEQIAFPYFMVISTNKTLEYVEIETIQMHTLVECADPHDCNGECGGDWYDCGCGCTNASISDNDLCVDETSCEETEEGICKCDLPCDGGYFDCMGVCDGTAVQDGCGICGGDGSSCPPVADAGFDQLVTLTENGIMFAVDASGTTNHDKIDTIYWNLSYDADKWGESIAEDGLAAVVTMLYIGDGNIMDEDPVEIEVELEVEPLDGYGDSSFDTVLITATENPVFCSTEDQEFCPKPSGFLGDLIGESDYPGFDIEVEFLWEEVTDWGIQIINPDNLHNASFYLPSYSDFTAMSAGQDGDGLYHPVNMQFKLTVTHENGSLHSSICTITINDPATCCKVGDLNGDNAWNVLDVVMLANCTLAHNCAEGTANWAGSDCGDVNCYGCAGDMNEDGSYNVLDIVILSNCALSQSCGG